MSVTIYLTDHRGKQIAFFYRIDSERYLTCPQLIWACRQHPEYQGRAESKEHFIEQAKDVMKQLNKISQNNRSTCEKIPCDTCGLTSPKMEAQLTCPDCLTEPNTNK
jgi:hypothetical protein